ncbi:MAG: leucine-rich repeat domain-containing protein [Chlamydiia bacterium]|nr:leucine-rich repeat domain-containing protein [Chlamydiia bacterium]
MGTVTYCYTFSNQQTVAFQENLEWGSITSILHNENIPPVKEFTRSLTNLLAKLEENGKKIRARYPNGLTDETVLDFSNLELTHLPPHIVLEGRNATEINISGNNIFWLPVEIQKLPHLKKLDISGNTLLQPNLPTKWLKETGIETLIANDMGFNFIPRGLEGRFFSNQARQLDFIDLVHTMILEDN